MILKHIDDYIKESSDKEYDNKLFGFSEDSVEFWIIKQYISFNYDQYTSLNIKVIYLLLKKYYEECIKIYNKNSDNEDDLIDNLFDECIDFLTESLIKKDIANDFVKEVWNKFYGSSNIDELDKFFKHNRNTENFKRVLTVYKNLLDKAWL